MNIYKQNGNSVKGGKMPKFENKLIDVAKLVLFAL